MIPTYSGDLQGLSLQQRAKETLSGVKLSPAAETLVALMTLFDCAESSSLVSEDGQINEFALELLLEGMCA